MPSKPLAKPAHAPIRDKETALAGSSVMDSKVSFFFFCKLFFLALGVKRVRLQRH